MDPKVNGYVAWATLGCMAQIVALFFQWRQASTPAVAIKISIATIFANVGQLFGAILVAAVLMP